MRLLLDTHVLLWWLEGSSRLPGPAKKLIVTAGSVFVSAATAWEIAIQQTIGKLKTPGDLEAALAASRFEPLGITVGHALSAGALPRHHDDPFDRMLLAQARLEGLRLLTHDERLAAYGPEVLLCGGLR